MAPSRPTKTCGPDRITPDRPALAGGGHCGPGQRCGRGEEKTWWPRLRSGRSRPRLSRS